MACFVGVRQSGVRLVVSLCVSIRNWGFPFEFAVVPRLFFCGGSIPNSEGNGSLSVCGFSIGLALLIGARILGDTTREKNEIQFPHNPLFKKVSRVSLLFPPSVERGPRCVIEDSGPLHQGFELDEVALPLVRPAMRSASPGGFGSACSWVPRRLAEVWDQMPTT